MPAGAVGVAVDPSVGVPPAALLERERGHPDRREQHERRERNPALRSHPSPYREDGDHEQERDADGKEEHSTRDYPSVGDGEPHSRAPSFAVSSGPVAHRGASVTAPRGPRTFYRTFYRPERSEPDSGAPERPRQVAPVAICTSLRRTSKPVRRRSPTLGRFDSSAAASGLLIRLVAVVEEYGVAIRVAEPGPMADA